MFILFHNFLLVEIFVSWFNYCEILYVDAPLVYTSKKWTSLVLTLILLLSGVISSDTCKMWRGKRHTESSPGPADVYSVSSGLTLPCKILMIQCRPPIGMTPSERTDVRLVIDKASSSTVEPNSGTGLG